MALLAVSCLEPAVSNTLHIALHDDGSAEITLQVSLLEPDKLGGRPRLERRLGDLRDALLRGTDEWHPIFGRLSPIKEDVCWSKQEDQLVYFERRAVVPSANQLSPFFSDLGTGFFLEIDSNTASLALFPGSAARATRSQRQQIERTLDEWSDVLAAYVDAADALFLHLETRPERAAIAFRHLFDDVAPFSEAKGELDREEEELVSILEERILDALQILLIDEDEAYSLDEISHLVFDPFPARVTLTLPGPISASEGFDETGDHSVEIAGLGLWRSLESLESSWIEPQLLQRYVTASAAAETTDFDLDALTAAPRRVDSLVSAAEIRAALLARLQPAPVYRVTWSRARG